MAGPSEDGGRPQRPAIRAVPVDPGAFRVPQGMGAAMRPHSMFEGSRSEERQEMGGNGGIREGAPIERPAIFARPALGQVPSGPAPSAPLPAQPLMPPAEPAAAPGPVVERVGGFPVIPVAIVAVTAVAIALLVSE